MPLRGDRVAGIQMQLLNLRHADKRFKKGVKADEKKDHIACNYIYSVLSALLLWQQLKCGTNRGKEYRIVFRCWGMENRRRNHNPVRRWRNGIYAE